MLSGTVFDIKKFSINDGPGIRTTVFFKGCPLDCWWCHNPESKSTRPELMYRVNRCSLCGECQPACPRGAIEIKQTDSSENIALFKNQTNRSICENCGQCAEACFYDARELVGREMNVDDVMAEIERDVPFFDQSGGGVTFSGGEPLLQRKFLLELLLRCREHDIHTVVDTSGYARWEVFESIRQHVNLFLYDLKIMDESRHLRYTGISNKLILENLRRLDSLGSKCIIRIPLIPGINDDDDNLQATGEFLAGMGNIISVELMGYHDIAQAKYEALGLQYRLQGTRAPLPEALQKAGSKLKELGLRVK